MAPGISNNKAPQLNLPQKTKADSKEAEEIGKQGDEHVNQLQSCMDGGKKQSAVEKESGQKLPDMITKAANDRNQNIQKVNEAEAEKQNAISEGGDIAQENAGGGNNPGASGGPGGADEQMIQQIGQNFKGPSMANKSMIRQPDSKSNGMSQIGGQGASFTSKGGSAGVGASNDPNALRQALGQKRAQAADYMGQMGGFDEKQTGLVKMGDQRAKAGQQFGAMKNLNNLQAQSQQAMQKAYGDTGKSLKSAAKGLNQASQVLTAVAQGLKGAAAAVAPIPFVGPALSKALSTASQVVGIVGKALKAGAQKTDNSGNKMNDKSAIEGQKKDVSRAKEAANLAKETKAKDDAKKVQGNIDGVSNAKDQANDALGSNVREQKDLAKKIQENGGGKVEVDSADNSNRGERPKIDIKNTQKTQKRSKAAQGQGAQGSKGPESQGSKAPAQASKAPPAAPLPSTQAPAAKAPAATPAPAAAAPAQAASAPAQAPAASAPASKPAAEIKPATDNNVVTPPTSSNTSKSTPSSTVKAPASNAAPAPAEAVQPVEASNTETSKKSASAPKAPQSSAPAAAAPEAEVKPAAEAKPAAQKTTEAKAPEAKATETEAKPEVKATEAKVEEAKAEDAKVGNEAKSDEAKSDEAKPAAEKPEVKAEAKDPKVDSKADVKDNKKADDKHDPKEAKKAENKDDKKAEEGKAPAKAKKKSKVRPLRKRKQEKKTNKQGGPGGTEVVGGDDAKRKRREELLRKDAEAVLSASGGGHSRQAKVQQLQNTYKQVAQEGSVGREVASKADEALKKASVRMPGVRLKIAEETNDVGGGGGGAFGQMKKPEIGANQNIKRGGLQIPRLTAPNFLAMVGHGGQQPQPQAEPQQVEPTQKMAS